jgi:hypothetical protein
MRIVAGKTYFGATLDGVIRVMPREAIQARGVVKLWDCQNKDYDPDKPELGRFIGLGRKYIFETHEEARKVVFKMKLRIAK